MIQPTLFLKRTLLGFFTILLLLFAASSVFGYDSPYESFFPEITQKDPAPSRSAPAKTPKNKPEEAGTIVGCPNCAATEKTSSNVRDLSKIAKKAAPAKPRAPRILPDFVDTPTSTSPTPDSKVWGQFPDIAAYSDSNDVATAIRIAQKNARRASLGMCYKYVKDAIFNSQVKLTSKRLIGNRVFPDRKIRRGDFGQTAIKSFEEEGFDNLLQDPETKHLITSAASAPKGAIMVYRGGTRGGHVEIKTDYGANADYVSDFKSNSSALYNELQGRKSPSGRMELVGVMVKRTKKAL